MRVRDGNRKQYDTLGSHKAVDAFARKLARDTGEARVYNDGNLHVTTYKRGQDGNARKVWSR